MADFAHGAARGLARLPQTRSGAAACRKGADSFRKRPGSISNSPNFSTSLALLDGENPRCGSTRPNVEELNPPVYGAFRIGGIAQLLFAEPKRHELVRINAKRCAQRLHHGCGSTLAEVEIVFPGAASIAVSDDGKSVAEKERVMQSVGNVPDGHIRAGLDAVGIRVELNHKREIRKSRERLQRRRRTGGILRSFNLDTVFDVAADCVHVD
jgi:hypothetical protein